MDVPVVVPVVLLLVPVGLPVPLVAAPALLSSPAGPPLLPHAASAAAPAVEAAMPASRRRRDALNGSLGDEELMAISKGEKIFGKMPELDCCLVTNKCQQLSMAAKRLDKTTYGRVGVTS